MKKTLLIIATILLSSYINASPITLLSNKYAVNNVPINKITDIIKNYINTDNYLKVQVQPIYKQNGNGVDYLLAYLLSKTSYSLTITKININADYQVLSVEPNYHLTKQDLSQQPNVSTPTCPDSSVEFVTATAFPEVPTAKQYAIQIYNDASNKGYKAIELIGNDANIANFENYLACPNLKGFFNIGHGDPQGIELSDGMLSYDVLQSAALKGKLNEKTVVIFNSCEVFNDPMKSALINKGTDSPPGIDAQKFGGGISDLTMVTSEHASACFWDAALNQQPMDQALQTCAKNIDPKDTFGFGGLGSDTLNAP